MLLKKIEDTFELIKFSHSIFAMPFALGAMLIAAQGFPSIRLIALIILALVSARTSAMAFNRWLDADIDAQNPRTQSRHIPSGILSSRYVLGLTFVSALCFLVICYFIGSLSFWLSPLALAILFFYSYTKRFTDTSQLFLGLALGIAPIGAWIAVTNHIGIPSLIIGLAVLFWVAGFDLIYATQDYEFDRQNQVHSLVVRLGISKALNLSRILHVLSFLLLLFLGYQTSLDWPYFVGLLLMAMLFFYQHTLVRPNDLSRVDAAFFTTNGCISLIFLVSIYFAL